MTPNKQVSPVIRISQGERDASARATHLEAASKKSLETTNERIQMSSTTNFKRIALVAVAALGLGVLSSVPSQAAITGVIAVTAADGTATTALADSTTAGSIKVRWLATGTSDTVGITAVRNSSPAGATTGLGINFYPSDTLTSVTAATMGVNTGTTRTVAQATGGDTAVVSAVAAGYASGTFLIQTGTAGDVAGTYTFTLTITPHTTTGAETTKVVTQDVSIVVSTATDASTTAVALYSKAWIGTTSVDSATAADATSVSFPATASATAAGAIWVKLRNGTDASGATLDSLTVTIDKGTVGTTSGSLGKSVVLAYAPTAVANGMQVRFYPDGTAGTATITIATKNAGTFTKTVYWYGTDVKTITATGRLTVIGATETAATTNAVRAQAFDANGINNAAGTALYSYSSDTSVVSNNGTACGATAYSSTDLVWYTYCPLTVVASKAGTVTITVRDAATVALSTVASAGVSVRVSQGTASSFTLKTDKASYAPGEKGYLILTVLDAAGLVMPSQSSTATLAAGGISTTGQLGASSDTMTATAFATARSSSGANSPSSNDPIKFYVFYAPTQGGNLTFSATGASTFSTASQGVRTSVTVAVVDNAAAALAAVTALATTVASLKTLITTLTNLVLKIQKKVKA